MPDEPVVRVSIPS